MECAKLVGTIFGPVEEAEIRSLHAYGAGKDTTVRGLIATEDLSVGAEIVKLPVESCFDAGRARTLLPAWAEDLSDEAATGLLLVLLRKKVTDISGTGGQQAYATSLPQAFTALHWNDDQLGQLDGTSFHEVARSYREESALEWSYLSEGPCCEWTAKHGLTLEDFLWGKSAVSSRQCQVKEGQPDEGLRVAPGLDLLNHSLEPNAEFSLEAQDGKQKVLVKTISAVRKGEQVTISYGPLSNASMLIFHGFSLSEPNPHDCMEVLLRLPSTAARVAAVVALAEKVGESESFQVIAAADEEPEVVTRHCLFKHAPLPSELLVVFRLQVGEGDLAPAQENAAMASLRKFLQQLGKDRSGSQRAECDEGVEGALARVRHEELKIIEASLEALDVLAPAR